MQKRNTSLALLAATVLSAVASPAFAQVDYSDMIDAVDFAATGTAVTAVAAALITLYVIIKGIKLAMGFVRGG